MKPSKYSDYYPPNHVEDEYQTWLEGPGEGLAAVVGAMPSWDEQLADRGLLQKAMPKYDSDANPVKKAPQHKASKKQAGATGKVRYSYPQEEAGRGSKVQPEEPNPVQVPSETKKPSADPAALADQLHISVATLTRIAQRFASSKKLDGRKGFVAFMQSRMKSFTAKHRLDGDYWGLIFDALVGQ